MVGNQVDLGSRGVIKNGFTAVDLFCGSGAVTTALKRKGFRVLVSLDNDPVACRTYSLNHPDVRLIEQDIVAVDPHTIADSYEAFGVDLLVICAPCQPFSSQNRKRKNDARAQLLIHAVAFAEALQPRCILIENVPGLATQSNAPILKNLESRLRLAGYRLSIPRRIDAADVGVPQRRIRCVMLASRDDRAVRYFEKYKFRRRRRTVREAIGGLLQISSGDRHPADRLHSARAHQAIALERLRAIPKDGGSRSELPDHLRLRCHRDNHSYSDVYGRMRWDDVAPTLTTGCDDLTRGRFAHPEQDRAITLREAALLQTFPKRYRFTGNRRQVARQIGNAVPVAMVEGLVPVIKKAISYSRKPNPSLDRSSSEPGKKKVKTLHFELDQL